jgi:hypothetical protein
MMQEEKISGFVAGTLVHTDKGLVPIELIKVGDMVFSKPEDGFGQQTFKPVKRVVVTESAEVCLVKCILKDVLETAEDQGRYIDNEELTNIVVTNNHLFCVVDQGFVKAEFLVEGDLFELFDGRLAVVYDGAGASATKAIYHIPGDSRGWTLYNEEFLDEESVYWQDIDLTPSVMRQRILNTDGRDVYLGWYKDFRQRYICTVYNFEVVGTRTYYVGDLGIWVHDVSANIS